MTTSIKRLQPQVNTTHLPESSISGRPFIDNDLISCRRGTRSGRRHTILTGRGALGFARQLARLKSIGLPQPLQLRGLSNSSEKISASAPLGHLQLKDFRLRKSSNPGQCWGVDIFPP
jgi:hypothetical protein